MIIKAFIITIITLAILDFIWLQFIAKKFYQKQIGYLYANKVKWWAIIAFYVFYSLSIIFLAVLPALTNNNLTALIAGGLLGLASYGAYNFTNQAIIKNWPIKMTFIDMAWGISMTALAAELVYFLLKNF